MVKRLFTLLVYIVALVVPQFIAIQCYGQSPEARVQQIVSVLEKIHVDPIGINDELSGRIYNEFIETLDPGTLIFLQEDLSAFSLHKDSIDDQINNGEFTFFNLVKDVFSIRLQQVDSIIEAVFTSDIDFRKKDSLRFNSGLGRTYAANLVKLSERWTKMIKYKTLRVMYSTFPSVDLENNDSINLALEYSLEKSKNEMECEIDYFSREDKEEFDETMLVEFLNSIAISYDPHSAFFTDDAKDSFENSLSKESLTFGMGFTEEEGVIKVSNLIPGGPAWKSNQINKDDVVKNILLDDGSELSISCISDYELEDILNANSITSVNMSLVKKNGQVVDVELTKEKLETDENVMMGIVMDGARKVGYLSIPSFYSDWEEEVVKGCANDVAKEILKLKKDSIEGLIIDLRFNGGGSLREAIDFAGIFIDVGPLGIIAGYDDKPQLMKDFNRGTVYRGPLVILINGASASASEVLAGALQLHNRAVIVGSSSYGKSTGQIVVPIDTNYWSVYGNEQPRDFVKVTVDRLYNIKSGSHQQIGIQPDVVIPDIWKYYIPSEKDERYSLANDSIAKKVIYKPYQELPITELQSSSKERVKKNIVLKNIVVANDSIKEDIEKSFAVPLSLSRYWEYANANEENYDKLMKLLQVDQESDFSVSYLKYYEEIEQIDDHFKEKNEDLFNRIKKDVMLGEAYQITVDLIRNLE